MGFQKVLSKEELSAGEAKCVALNGRKIAVFNVDGKYYAIDDACTHNKAASLSKGTVFTDDKGACEIICPWHGARFDLQCGKVLALPALSSVCSYPVRLEGNEIMVDL